MAVTQTRTKTLNGTGFVDTVSASAVETTAAIQIALDRDAGIRVGFGVDIVGTSATFTVQHTFDPNPVTATLWYDHADVVGDIADVSGNYAFGITGIRLKVTAITAAVVSMYVVQGGGRSR